MVDHSTLSRHSVNIVRKRSEEWAYVGLGTHRLTEPADVLGPHDLDADVVGDAYAAVHARGAADLKAQHGLVVFLCQPSAFSK